jgi:glycosyltransferase involved in cell wall biosynthesis
VIYFSTFKSKVWDYGQSLNKMIDYMLSGRPIIGSYSGFPSMINEAECGVFIPAEDAQALKDAILRFADMPSEERDAIGARGREWIIANRRFTKLAYSYLDIMFPKV